MRSTRFPWSLLLAVLVLLCGCPTEEPPPADDDDTVAGSPYAVPLDPDSPWPKFRRDAAQTGMATVVPGDGLVATWSFATGKGIFSTPVVGGDGTVYVGSADRFFYALNPDGSERWSVETGEIIDSSALLDDLGRVYFGSGDGVFRSLDAATGEEVWRFEADDPAVNDAYINWFEGNVAMGPDGTLIVPNDNFFLYALDRDDGEVVWRFTLADQTWSLPAVDAHDGDLYFGNNNLIETLADNVWAIDGDGNERWSAFNLGSMVASPLLLEDRVLMGSFDGYLRAYDRDSGALQWEFPTRDHIYASPALLPDGRIVQPSADGTIYALEPADGALSWAYDTREPVRSSPAVDADGTIYVGSGEGRLYVLNPDGTLRWAIQLITDGRNDLNGSPALGHDGVFIAGESGELFAIPYDWCLRDEAATDERCIPGPGEDLPADGASLLYTTPFGEAVVEPPSIVEGNATLAFSLFVREGGDTVLAHLDADSLQVSVEPEAPVDVEVSGDRRFLTVEPEELFLGDVDRMFTVSVSGRYLVDPDREGLAFSGGEVGGTFDEAFTFERAETPPMEVPLPFPSAPGEDAGTWELYRLAAPMPAILPSYNQIGFDSLHYLVGLVEGDGEHGVAWVVGALPEVGSGATAVDPATTVVFPFDVYWHDGLLTLDAAGGLRLDVMNVSIAFNAFRMASRLDDTGTAGDAPQVHVTTICSEIQFYGPFLQMLGFCNPQTDVLDVFGTALLRPHDDGVQSAPVGAGDLTVEVTDDAIVASLMGSTVSPDQHRVALLAVDAATGSPLYLDYAATDIEVDGGGLLVGISLDTSAVDLPDALRVYLMVDTYPAAMASVGG